jgi:hypothetical protein
MTSGAFLFLKSAFEKEGEQSGIQVINELASAAPHQSNKSVS